MTTADLPLRLFLCRAYGWTPDQAARMSWLEIALAIKSLR